MVWGAHSADTSPTACDHDDLSVLGVLWKFWHEGDRHAAVDLLGELEREGVSEGRSVRSVDILLV
jgi:hypothetical protein